jgi:hypothetical protein
MDASRASVVSRCCSGIGCVDLSRLLAKVDLPPSHDGNPSDAVPFKMSGLGGHRSIQAVKRHGEPQATIARRLWPQLHRR